MHTIDAPSGKPSLSYEDAHKKSNFSTNPSTEQTLSPNNGSNRIYQSTYAGGIPTQGLDESYERGTSNASTGNMYNNKTHGIQDEQ